MSLFDAMKKKDTKASAPKTERFFGEVVGYDVASTPNVVTVKHSVTGDVRKVVLDTSIEVKVGDGQKRPDVADFAKRGKMKTEIGGFIRIEGASLDATAGVWKARWITGAVQDPSEGHVATFAEARVGQLRKGANGNAFRALDVLDGEKTARVADAGALQTAVADAIRSHGGALIRCAQKDSGELGVRTIFAGRAEPGVDRVEKALADPELAKVTDWIAGKSASDVCEVVPLKRHFFGKDAATHPSLDRSFIGTSEDGHKTFMKGFTTILASFKKHEDGSAFVSSATAARFGFDRLGKFEPFTDTSPAPANGVTAQAPAPQAPEAAATPASPSIDDVDTFDFIGEVDLDEMMSDAEHAGAGARTPGPRM